MNYSDMTLYPRNEEMSKPEILFPLHFINTPAGMCGMEEQSLLPSLGETSYKGRTVYRTSFRKITWHGACPVYITTPLISTCPSSREILPNSLTRVHAIKLDEGKADSYFPEEKNN